MGVNATLLGPPKSQDWLCTEATMTTLVSLKPALEARHRIGPFSRLGEHWQQFEGQELSTLSPY